MRNLESLLAGERLRDADERKRLASIIAGIAGRAIDERNRGIRELNEERRKATEERRQFLVIIENGSRQWNVPNRKSAGSF